MMEQSTMAGVHRFTTQVRSNTRLTSTVFDLRVAVPDASFTPGQFVNLYLNRGDYMLPRPISIADGNDGEFRFLFAVVGKGTELLSQLKAGDSLDMTTTLGNGFTTSELAVTFAVGGGIGVPPVYAAAKRASMAGKDVTAVVGFRSEPILLDELAAEIGAERVHCAIEEKGAIPDLEKRYPAVSFTYGNVVDILRKIVPLDMGRASMVACGPTPMLKALQSFASPDRFELQLSLEERMGCGFGCCAGCVAEIRDPGTGKIQRLGVCSKGPVFAGETVVFA